MQAAIDAGLDVNQFGQRLSFFFNAHNDFLEEIAKFRAARRLWARIMRDRFGATNPRAQQLRFHTQTAGSTLTAQQPDNNIVRVALQALAAVLGGTQSLHCNGRDEALALPTEEAARHRASHAADHRRGERRREHGRSGRRLVRHRSADERDRARRRSAARRGSTRAGGTLAAIEAGLIQREIQESAYRAQHAIDSGDAVVVGVNRFADRRGRRRSRAVPGRRRSRSGSQIERRARRAGRAQRVGLARPRSTRVTQAARDGSNLVPPIIAAVEAHATVGEISDAMRAVFGEYQETATL